MKVAKYNDLEEMVYRFQLTYDELIDILDIKYFARSTKGFTLPPGIYEIFVINMTESLYFLNTKSEYYN